MAATVNYNIPAQGTTPPTAAQMALLSMVIAQVIMGDTDTTAAITHNFGVTAAGLGSGFPLVLFNANSLGTTPNFVSAVLTNSNVVTLSKASLVGSNGTFTVCLMRPSSLMQ